MTFPDGIDSDWATHDRHSPPADQLITSTDDNGRRWYVLEGHYRWSQPRHPDAAAAEAPYHAGWMQIRSYLIDNTALGDWRAWASRQDWHGRWMPESGSPVGLLLADHPYRWGWTDLETDDRTGRREDPAPGPLTVATSRYGGVANDRDQSDSRHLYTYTPSTALCELLGLHRLGDFQWGRDAQVQAAGVDTRTDGPNSVHVTGQALHDGLTYHGKATLWTVTAVKETVRSNYYDVPAGAAFERRYTASYLDDGTGLQMLSATAHTPFKRGRLSDPTAWHLAAPE